MFPRVIDCFPAMRSFPGCFAPDDEYVFDEYSGIAIPSGMPLSTTHEELPTIVPPLEYWKLKRLDNSANVMDYWIKSSQEWDIRGLESDAQLAHNS